MEKKEEHKKIRRREQLAWDKLDNTANLFPVIATEDMTNVYRISVTLTEKIDRVSCVSDAAPNGCILVLF